MPEADRFMGHVAKDASGCWLWSAYRMKNGYGQFRTPLRHELAHRASYRLFRGELQADLDVMHSCDNPGCVNPAHLSLGTRADNMADAKAKGRSARGMRHGMNKINETDAIAIRQARRPQAELATQFGLSQSTISQIRTGKRWAHLSAIGG
jgi:hypothetical protein